MKNSYMKQHVVAYFVPALTALFFLFLLGIAIFSVRYKTKQFSGDAMASDIHKLALLFNDIHRDCTILSFDYQKNPINFLTVGSFAGSEVGSMNVAHPENWKGPYLNDNLAMQNKEYQIVHTKKGYFIVPGEGVQLSDGQIIGKDLLLNEDVDIEALSAEGQPLNFQAKKLSAHLKLDGADDELFDLNELDLDDLPNINLGD